jgi:hypothetical protein
LVNPGSWLQRDRLLLGSHDDAAAIEADIALSADSAIQLAVAVEGEFLAGDEGASAILCAVEGEVALGDDRQVLGAVVEFGGSIEGEVAAAVGKQGGAVEAGAAVHRQAGSSQDDRIFGLGVGEVDAACVGNQHDIVEGLGTACEDDVAAIDQDDGVGDRHASRNGQGAACDANDSGLGGGAACGEALAPVGGGEGRLGHVDHHFGGSGGDAAGGFLGFEFGEGGDGDADAVEDGGWVESGVVIVAVDGALGVVVAHDDRVVYQDLSSLRVGAGLTVGVVLDG